jgi:FkbM family methyltransferase
VEAPRIAFGHDSIEDANRFWDKMEFLENGKINLAIGNLQMEVNCQDEFMDVSEIFCGQIFNFHINNSLRNVIIDVGMGIGGSVLYFLEKDANSTVYGFEPFHQTFGNATHNIGKNRDYPENGVNLFNYGLSDKNESIDICFDEKMSCETVSVRRASEILAGILCNHNEENKILKVDCEGEEHAILKDLEGSGILGEFDFIMVAWHYRGKEVLLDALAKCGFSYWTADKLGSTGLIYAYKQSGRRRS